jgi:hypothetical protein
MSAIVVLKRQTYLDICDGLYHAKDSSGNLVFRAVRRCMHAATMGTVTDRRRCWGEIIVFQEPARHGDLTLFVCADGACAHLRKEYGIPEDGSVLEQGLVWRQ